MAIPSKPMKLSVVSCMLLAMLAPFARTADNPVEQLAQDARVKRALEWISANQDWITEQQIRLSEIPAPEFSEGSRANALKKLFDLFGYKGRIDSVGNVIAERPGSDPKNVILIAAHIDTVFPAGTDVSVKRRASRLEGPGISDNGAGVAALVGLARGMNEGKIRTAMTVVFAGDVGEEGEGNLRGIRQLMESYSGGLRAVIAIDGASVEHITMQALASRRVEVTVTGPGGHSWSDFGLPNPITAIARAIVKFSAVRVPKDPRTTLNVGLIEGGTSVNAIPFSASMKVDMRSENEKELDHLEQVLHDSVQKGIEDEIAAVHADPDSLDAKFKSLGVRPGGEIAADAPLLDAIRNVERFLGNRSRPERSSTDANIPLSLGIPAIAVGGGGRGGGSHSLSEWYDPTDRDIGVKRILLTVLAVAGLQP
ncbi:MAG: M20/M25/M40 family metallo-hydrolase [Candidatus Acidiferrales bacterium]